MVTIHIKNMVCPRCITSVINILQNEGISYSKVELGKVELTNELDMDSIVSLKDELLKVGFELLDDKDNKLINNIKTYIISMIHHNDSSKTFNFSDLLSKHLNKDYSILSKTFSKTEGITIEKYIANQKVEKVKELLVYNELTISQIAVNLNYSSTAHLSSQFKKVTGMTPSYFKKMVKPNRKSIDKL